MGCCNEIWKCVLNMMRCHYLRQLVELTYVVVRLGVGGLGVSLIGGHGGDQKGDDNELQRCYIGVILSYQFLNHCLVFRVSYLHVVVMIVC